MKVMGTYLFISRNLPSTPFVTVSFELSDKFTHHWRKGNYVKFQMKVGS